jgi:hypothetical protein
MDSQASDNGENVIRKIWRRFSDYTATGWRLVSGRVPANSPKTDPWLIKYADCEAFFNAVSKGSRKSLIKKLNTHGPEVVSELSKSYNENGETPLLVAIKKGNMNMVKYLVGKLDVPIGQIGRFLWRDVEYNDVPALYVALVSGEMDIAAYLLYQEDWTQVPKIFDSIMSSSIDVESSRNPHLNLQFLIDSVLPLPQSCLAAQDVRIECIDGDGASRNQINVNEEPPVPDELQSSASESSKNTTPEEAKPIIPNPVPELPKTRGVKVRYNFDEAAAASGDDDFLPGNNKKKRKTGSRHAKVELLDIGGHEGYRPSRKKRINRKDPSRCHVCRQR